MADRGMQEEVSEVERLRRANAELRRLFQERVAELKRANELLSKEISDHKRAEQELAGKERFLNEVFDCIQDGISVLDRDMNIIRVNKIIEKWHPYMMPICGKKCYTAYHNRDTACDICPTIQAFNEKKMIVEIVPFTGEHGDRGWLELFAYPMVGPDGEVTGVVEHVRDITGRMQAENALQEAKTRAELYVDLMGHDIGNMNQAIMGYLEMAQERLHLEANEKELIDKPLELLKNSSALIDNVKRLQRARSGELKTGAVDIGMLITDLVERSLKENDKGVTIDYTTQSGYMVEANELIKDLFGNILENAMKYSKEHGKIRVGAVPVKMKGKTFYRVEVEDDGPGVPGELKSGIFSELSGKEKYARRKGLGLQIVKTLVHAYGGRVWVEDRVPGDFTKGARFVVLLPALY
jgi:PAS domain S-box-containing protein